jgi:hypothetical protein
MRFRPERQQFEGQRVEDVTPDPERAAREAASFLRGPQNKPDSQHGLQVCPAPEHSRLALGPSGNARKRGSHHRKSC